MLYENSFQNREELTAINVSTCRYQTEAARGFPAHCHSFFELEYSIKGDRLAFLNGRKLTLPEGGLLFIPILEAHSTTNIAPYTENVILQFSRDFLYANARTMSRKAIIIPAGELRNTGYIVPEKGSRLAECLGRLSASCPIHCVDDIDVDERVSEDQEQQREKTMRSGHYDFGFTYTPYLEWKINGLTMELITLLFDQGYLEIAVNMGDAMDVVRIQPVLNRLISQPEMRLSMKEAAKMACMSYSNFSRTFKQLIGYNYVDYCNIARVHLAEELLSDTKLTVTDIAQQLNFGCVGYFNRIFKKYNGNTPLHYRKKAQI
jgi:AraC-like DNA-binding protein